MADKIASYANIWKVIRIASYAQISAGVIKIASFANIDTGQPVKIASYAKIQPFLPVKIASYSRILPAPTSQVINVASGERV